MTFAYRAADLWCEEVPLAEIAAEVGTPVYVYSRAEITDRARAFQAAAGRGSLICFAAKANNNLALLRIMADQGLGADVTSGGELYLALEAGFPPERIIFSGVGKADWEITMALGAGIRALHVESAAELDVIAALAAGLGLVAPVGVRLNPDIDAATHPYISTGLTRHKFGIEVAQGVNMLREATASPHLRPTGIAAHIGSQISDLSAYAEAAGLLIEVAQELAAGGLHVDYIDIGGGLAVDETRWGAQIGQDLIAAWGEAGCQPVRNAGFNLIAEPGRAIIAPAGSLLTSVIYTKERANKRFIIADAGMNDLLRPALYQAVHPIVPVRRNVDLPAGRSPIPADVVGPICESSDFMGQGLPLPPVGRGDLLAIMNAGAYGFAMSSRYNGRLRAAEVLVDGERFANIRRRETMADLRSDRP